MNSEITISIVSHGHGALIDRLLGDLDRQADEAGMRIILTYNIPELPINKTHYPRLAISEIHNVNPKGFGANHNAAFEKCGTKWFVVLNPDVHLPADPFRQLRSEAEKLEGIGVIAPSIVNSSGAPEDAIRKNLTPLSVVFRRALGNRKPLSSPNKHEGFFWIAGMFMMFPSEVFRAIAGFDERFFLYCEDYDICARLHLAGYKLVVDTNTRAVHDAQRDSHRSLKHLRLHLTSLFKVWSSSAFWKITIDA